MPPEDRAWGVNRTSLADVPRFSLAHWSARTVRWIWLTIVGVGLILLVWATWSTGRHGNDRDWTTAGAVWMLAMFFVSPLTRHYYMALALPAIVVVWRALRAERARSARRKPGSLLAAAAVAAWIVGLVALGWDLGRWYGLHLGVLAILLSATVWAWRCETLQIPPDNGQE